MGCARELGPSWSFRIAGYSWAFDGSLDLPPRATAADFDFVQLARDSFVAMAGRREQWPSGIKFLCVHCDASSMMAADDAQEAHRCGPTREGLGGTALAMREGPRQRQCSARLRRQLHHTGPRRLRLYGRKGRGGAPRRRGKGQRGAVTMSVLRRRRSSQLDCGSTVRKGFAGRRWRGRRDGQS